MLLLYVLASLGFALLGGFFFWNMRTGTSTCCGETCPEWEWPEASNNPRIVYSIDHRARDGKTWPSDPFDARGISHKEKIVLEAPAFWCGSLTLENRDQVLLVNGQPIKVGESYNRRYWFFSWNPWVFLTTQFEVANQGALRQGRAIYVCGEIKEGFLPNPLGLLVLGVLAVLAGKEALEEKNKVLLGSIVAGGILSGITGGLMGRDIGELFGMVFGGITGALVGATVIAGMVTGIVEEIRNR